MQTLIVSPKAGSHGILATTLFDSGSELELVSRAFVESSGLTRRVKLSANPRSIIGLGQGQMMAKEEITLTWIFSNKSPMIDVCCYLVDVSEHEFDLLLGGDFLHKNQILMLQPPKPLGTGQIPTAKVRAGVSMDIPVTEAEKKAWKDDGDSHFTGAKLAAQNRYKRKWKKKENGASKAAGKKKEKKEIRPKLATEISKEEQLQKYFQGSWGLGSVANMMSRLSTATRSEVSDITDMDKASTSHPIERDAAAYARLSYEAPTMSRKQEFVNTEHDRNALMLTGVQDSRPQSTVETDVSVEGRTPTVEQVSLLPKVAEEPMRPVNDAHTRHKEAVLPTEEVVHTTEPTISPTKGNSLPTEGAHTSTGEVNLSIENAKSRTEVDKSPAEGAGTTVEGDGDLTKETFASILSEGIHSSDAGMASILLEETISVKESIVATEKADVPVLDQSHAHHIAEKPQDVDAQPAEASGFDTAPEREPTLLGRRTSTSQEQSPNLTISGDTLIASPSETSGGNKDVWKMIRPGPALTTEKPRLIRTAAYVIMVRKVLKVQ